MANKFLGLIEIEDSDCLTTGFFIEVSKEDNSKWFFNYYNRWHIMEKHLIIDIIPPVCSKESIQENLDFVYKEMRKERTDPVYIRRTEVFLLKKYINNWYKRKNFFEKYDLTEYEDLIQVANV